MRFFEQPASHARSRIPSGTHGEIALSSPTEWGRLRNASNEVTEVACLACPSEPCRFFRPSELPKLAGASDSLVCPTDALRFDSSHVVAMVTDACIQCGLCVLRCPYGSLRLDEDRRPETAPYVPLEYREVTATEHEAGLANFTRQNSRSLHSIRNYIEQAVLDLRFAQQATFYPLVGRLLTAAGLPTWVPRRGDTNNRIDAIVMDPIDSIPIEIKSPTETLYINVKAVQQALENKIVLRRRHRVDFPSCEATTTLVIGYQYPADRSDVTELIEDIRATYNVRIGLVDLSSLLGLVCEVYKTGKKLTISRLARHEGRL
jgi:Fe-S-cluster-containing hydrogenase component 2